MDLLVSAIRQYRHNNSDEFVFGYDKAETERVMEHTLYLLENLVLWGESVQKRAGVRMNDACTGALVDAREFLDTMTPKAG